MAYKHGVYVSEVSTSIIPAVNTTAGLPVVFGTAPIHLAKDRAMANKPILCHSYEEALGIISEYVETELSVDIAEKNKKKEKHTHER